MKLGFDLDGVILDHSRAKIQAARKHGYDIMPEQTPSDALKDLLPKETYRALQREIYDTDVARTTPLMEGAREGLMHAKETSREIWLISRRKNPRYAIAALRYHGLWPSLFNEANTHFVPTIEEKAGRAEQLGITHFLDDEEGVLQIMTSVSSRVLFDPWVVHGDSSFTTVPSWTAFLASLEK